MYIITRKQYFAQRPINKTYATVVELVASAIRKGRQIQVASVSERERSKSRGQSVVHSEPTRVNRKRNEPDDGENEGGQTKNSHRLLPKDMKKHSPEATYTIRRTIAEILTE